jgi:hypothetical protein
MPTYNGSVNVRRQRRDAYADDYVELKPKSSVVGIRSADAPEVHYDDGSILRGQPGDWVLEGLDGKLVVVPAAIIAEHYEPVDGDNEAFQATVDAVAPINNPPEDQGPIPFAGEPDPAASGVHAETGVGSDPDVLAAEAEAVKGEQDRARGLGEGAERAETKEQVQSQDPDATGFGQHADKTPDQEWADLSDEEKRERAQETLARNQAEIENRLLEITTAAIEQDVISPEEGQTWRDTGEAPEGVSVRQDAEGGYVVERQTGTREAGDVTLGHDTDTGIASSEGPGNSTSEPRLEDHNTNLESEPPTVEPAPDEE